MKDNLSKFKMSSENLNLFMNNQLRIKCATLTEFTELMQYLEDMGMKWSSGEKPTKLLIAFKSTRSYCGVSGDDTFGYYPYGTQEDVLFADLKQEWLTGVRPQPNKFRLSQQDLEDFIEGRFGILVNTADEHYELMTYLQDERFIWADTRDKPREHYYGSKVVINGEKHRKISYTRRKSGNVKTFKQLKEEQSV